MARPTIAALQAQIAAQQAQIEEREARIEALQAQLEGLQASFVQSHAALEQAAAELATHTTPSRRVQRAGYVAPAWQGERAAAMAAAKEAAMRLGRVCKVG